MKKLVVNENCIGCGYCASQFQEYFDINESGYSCAKKEELDEKDVKAVEEAASGCPVGAISIVEEEEKAA